MGKIVNEIKNPANDRDMTLKELAYKIGEAQINNYLFLWKNFANSLCSKNFATGLP